MAESDTHSLASQLDIPYTSTADPAMATPPPRTVKLAAPDDAAFPLWTALRDATEKDTVSDVLDKSWPTVAIIRRDLSSANDRAGLDVMDESDAQLLVSQLLLKARTAPEMKTAPILLPNTLILNDPVTPIFLERIALNNVVSKDKNKLKLDDKWTTETTS